MNLITTVKGGYKMCNTEQIKKDLESYIASTSRVFTSARRGNVIYIRIRVSADKVLEIRCNTAKNELKISLKRIVSLVGNKFTYNEMFKSAEISYIDFNKSNYMDIIVPTYIKYTNTTLIRLLGK